MSAFFSDFVPFFAQSDEPGVFGRLISDYNYSGLTSESAISSMDDSGPTKRRKIEVCAQIPGHIRIIRLLGSMTETDTFFSLWTLHCNQL